MIKALDKVVTGILLPELLKNTNTTLYKPILWEQSDEEDVLKAYIYLEAPGNHILQNVITITGLSDTNWQESVRPLINLIRLKLQGAEADIKDQIEDLGPG